jgi:hypothetical protein
MQRAEELLLPSKSIVDDEWLFHILFISLLYATKLMKAEDNAKEKRFFFFALL